MKDPEYGQHCQRRRIEIDGEHYYIVAGRNFAMATVPRENHPNQEKTRIIVEKVCETITKILSGEPEE